MIEALIRDDKRLICVVTIRQGPDKDRLDADVFLPGQGKTLSGVMPAGGEPTQLVARAIMTVYPISALTPAKTERFESINMCCPSCGRTFGNPDTGKREYEEHFEKYGCKGRIPRGVSDSDIDLRPASQILKDKAIPLSQEMIDQTRNAQQSAEETWVELDRRNDELDDLEKELSAREQKLVNKKINEEFDSHLGASLEVAACKALGQRNLELDEREADLVEREEKLTADIENFRKSHPEGDNSKRP